MNKQQTRKWAGSALLAVASMATGCGGEDEAGTGSLTVLLQPEPVIIDGLEPGEGTADIRDGWTAEFDKYIVAIGDVDLHLVADEDVEAEAGDVFVVDLAKLPADGAPLWNLEGLRAGRWEFSYATPGAADGSSRDESVSEQDYDEMVANDWTYLIDGTLSAEDGQSCPPAGLANPDGKAPNGNTSGGNDCYDAPDVRFLFGATVETHYGKCEIDGVPGVAIPTGGTQTVAITLHGDHLFFNGFPAGSEGGVRRLAQWLADCDLDLDGTVTQAELEAIDLSELPEIDDRYQLGGSPLDTLDNAYEYLRAQLKTQGHFQGEGGCDVDGEAHDHDHDEDDHED